MTYHRFLRNAPLTNHRAAQTSVGPDSPCTQAVTGLAVSLPCDETILGMVWICPILKTCNHGQFESTEVVGCCKPSVLKFWPDPWNISSGRFVRHDTACCLDHGFINITDTGRRLAPLTYTADPLRTQVDQSLYSEFKY